jgi:hypothetical protein
MKILIFSFLIIASYTSLFSQNTLTVGVEENQEIKTIFKKEKKDGFYGAFSVGYSPIDNKDALTISSRGGWIMDHFFALGVGGTGFVNDFNQLNLNFLPSGTVADLKLAGGYGGVVLEPILFPFKPVHFSFPILIGVGAAGSYSDYTYYSIYSVSDFFWVVEPQAELEINLTRWLRFALYAGYRYTSALDIKDISPTALRGYSAGITVKMGIF